jgi:hypothetical protein
MLFLKGNINFKETVISSALFTKLFTGHDIQKSFTVSFIQKKKTFNHFKAKTIFEDSCLLGCYAMLTGK